MLHLLFPKQKIAMAISETNPTQWTKFDNLGTWYAGRCQDNLDDLNVVVTFIQKWWRRQQQLKRKKTAPLIGSDETSEPSIIPANATDGKHRSIRNIAQRLQYRVDPQLQQPYRAHEKLDGTNLGVRCDGAVFGRRFRIHEKTYQGVPLEDTIPCFQQVLGIKHRMLNFQEYIFFDTTLLTLYGELMVNPNKFDYSRRSMGHKFYCFGAMISIDEPTEQICRDLEARLRKRAFNFHRIANHNNEDGNGRAVYRVMLNQAFRKMLSEESIHSTPMMGIGSLREVCLDLKHIMMNDGFEGVVLTAPIEGKFYKWKTSVEEKSGCHKKLSNISQSYSSFVLDLAGVDLDLLQCLIDVATPKERIDTVGQKCVSESFTARDLDVAYESALTKFDSLHAYFERDQQWIIIKYLQEEIYMDLSAITRKDQKIVNNFVKNRVMAVYKTWQKSKSKKNGK
jgi:hypothetical protein